MRICILLWFLPNVLGSPATLTDVMGSMFTAIDNCKTANYELTNSERIQGKMLTGSQKVWLNTSPLKCRIQMIKPNPGSELLYVTGQNNGKAWYYPNGFPYVTLSLDPMGSLIRENNHHTIFELGFSQIGRLLESMWKQHPERFRLLGMVTWDNKVCYKVVAENPEFGYLSYIAKAGEDLVSISKKFGVDDYLLMELNNADDYDDIEVGQKLKVPNFYAKSIELLIDKESMLPVKQTIFDDKSKYEQYEYRKLIVNPKFNPQLFDSGQLGKKS